MKNMRHWVNILVEVGGADAGHFRKRPARWSDIPAVFVLGLEVLLDIRGALCQLNERKDSRTFTTSPEEVARRFHEAYRRLAPEKEYATRMPWYHLAPATCDLMVGAAEEVLGYLRGDAPVSQEEPAP